MRVKWSFLETLLTCNGFIILFKNKSANKYFKILFVSIYNMGISVNIHFIKAFWDTR